MVILRVSQSKSPLETQIDLRKTGNPPLESEVTSPCACHHTILGMGWVRLVVRVDVDQTGTGMHLDLLQGHGALFFGARSLSVMVAGDLTATNARSSSEMPALWHSSMASDTDSVKPGL